MDMRRSKFHFRISFFPFPPLSLLRANIAGTRNTQRTALHREQVDVGRFAGKVSASGWKAEVDATAVVDGQELLPNEIDAEIVHQTLIVVCFDFHGDVLVPEAPLLQA